MSNTILCTAAISEVEGIIRDLHAAGFLSNDISVLVADKSGRRDRAHEHNMKASEGAVTSGGDTRGWPAGIRTLAVPGMGPLIAAGPIMAAFSGIAFDGPIGGLTGAFMDIGVPEFEAARYERKVKSGSALLCVRADDPEDADCAKDIFELAGAQDISAAGEVAEEDCFRGDGDRNFTRLEARTPWLL